MVSILADKQVNKRISLQQISRRLRMSRNGYDEVTVLWWASKFQETGNANDVTYTSFDPLTQSLFSSDGSSSSIAIGWKKVYSSKNHLHDTKEISQKNFPFGHWVTELQ